MLSYRNRAIGLSYHLNERLKGKVKMAKDAHPYPAAPDTTRTFPLRDGNPHYGGGDTDGAKLPLTPNAGKQPMKEAPNPVNRGVDD
jgi:hypothetical protein